MEDAARRARHEFFERARLALDADVVALGHTRDDQAETFLLRLLRGAGPKGLAGMHPRHGTIVRPLLCCRRRELREYLAASRIDYVEDESNADVRIPRNRVRAELLPLLEGRFNPSVVECWPTRPNWREKPGSGSSRRGSADREKRAKSAGRPQGLNVGRGPAGRVPPPVRRFAVWRTMSEVADGRPIAFDHVRAVLTLLEPGIRGLWTFQVRSWNVSALRSS